MLPPRLQFDMKLKDKRTKYVLNN
eukprot:COSAG02_NODE_39980_length_410_cov_1.163987_1_plen_23_part_01